MPCLFYVASYDKKCHHCASSDMSKIDPLFNHKNETCCDGSIVGLMDGLGSKTCCCEGKSFDPSKLVCCEGKIIDRPKDMEKDCCSMSHSSRLLLYTTVFLVGIFRF